MFPALFVILSFSVLYWLPIRRWMNQWGTRPSDLARVMAGDSLLPDPTYSGTMAVIVNATPEDIWPWLVQLGYQRGGLYSYDWLDRLFGYLDRPSATRILPEFQHLAVGDTIPLGRGPSWPVGVAEPNRALVLDMRNMGGMDWVWQFGLYPVDETRTQLVSRSRVRAHAVWARLLTHAIEPAGFVMTRRMLLGLKERAERLRATRAAFVKEEVDMAPDLERHSGSEDVQLDRRLSDIGWGLLFVLTGVIWIAPVHEVPEGTWLFGVAAILIGVNVVRYLKHIPMSGFSFVLGCLALLAGVGQFWRVDLPLLAICLVVIGVSLIVKPLLTHAA